MSHQTVGLAQARPNKKCSAFDPWIIDWGEPERAPQFGGSSSSSAMHYGAFVAFVVRTYTEPFLGFSPRTGYFENFQSLYSDLQ
jgi:hypothetical protein